MKKIKFAIENDQLYCRVSDELVPVPEKLLEKMEETASDFFEPEMAIPKNPQLPFFAYGLFKPGQLGFDSLQPHVKTVDHSALVVGKLFEKDGVPLFADSAGFTSAQVVKGALIYFDPANAESAYQAISQIEPDSLYKWEPRRTNGGVEVNILVATSLKGAIESHENYWDGSNDPVLCCAPDLVRQAMAKAKRCDFGSVERLLRLQMAYMLLWTAIERFASLRYHLGADVMPKIKRMGQTPAFTDAVKKYVNEGRSIVKTTGKDSKVLSPEKPDKAYDYYYQVRSNTIHRGKAIAVDTGPLEKCITELTSIFEEVRDNAFRECAYTEPNGLGLIEQTSSGIMNAAMTNSNPESPAAPTQDVRTPSNFLHDLIAEDVRTRKFGGAQVQTRFPPEPNGYLHIGHAKAICIDFGLADEFGGKTNLRFDDTNPEKEEQEYVDSIQADVRWLGFDWERLCYASDYFGQLYQWALKLVKEGKAYVDDLSADEIRRHRGTLTEPGKDSPYRNRTIEENLDLFVRMKNGEFPDGSRVLRAKIDMASPNLNMRDPVMYRILHATHHRTGDEWCIYPMYDYAHGQSDSIECVTHSMCTLEFTDHQPLYRWYIEQLGIFPSQQIEFDRLNITYTLLSKRRLLQLVQEKHVNGWDDPRMPTLSAFRRRGFTPEAIRTFTTSTGVSRTNGIVDIEMLEHFQRDDLNRRASRAMAVLRPLKLVIDNYPAGKEEFVEVANNPEDPSAGTRGVPFSKEIYVEQEDFREVPPPKYYRLSPGKEVRLRNAYFVTAQSVVKDAAGNVVEVHCTYDPASRGGNSPDGRKVKATMHWVSTAHAIPAEIRLYDKLFTKADPGDFAEGGSVLDNLNPNSLEILTGAKLEPSLANAKLEDRFQFERVGYFCLDPDSTRGKLVFNRTLPLKDSWAKIEKKAGA